MDAEIIAVGTELLLGDVLNTNAQYLSKELAGLGMNLYFQTVVGDNRVRLLQAYRNAFARADLVIATGGLGPTEDDLTKEAAAEYFHREMVLHQESLDRITGFFKTNKFAMTENNVKQAYIPAGATILPNEKGTAPGCVIEENDKILILLPGPPFEMIPMFESAVVPYIRTKTRGIFFSRTLRTVGIGESKLEDMVKDLIDAQQNPTIAPYAKENEAHLRITASAADEAAAKELVAPVAAEIYRRLGDNIYGEDGVTLAETVVSLLTANRMTVACAESCTGGLLTARLADVPGCSKVLNESVVTYSNRAKVERLGVDPATIAKFGAVSAETAAEMAEGVARTSSADMGVSVTGVAGPDGGTADKPVGLVYLGLWIGGETQTKELRLRGDRNGIRSRAAASALDMIRRALLERNQSTQGR